MNIPSQGKLYVLEGPDNVGKTTLANQLVNQLKLTTSCIYMSFPGRESSTLGKLIYEIHHNYTKFQIEKIDATALQALHIAAHIDCIKQKIIPLINTGNSIVLDRFWWSTLAYSETSNCDLKVIQKLLEAEKKAWKSIKPDHIFYIKRDPRSYSYSQALVNSYDNLFITEEKKNNASCIQNDDLNSSLCNILKIINKQQQVKSPQVQGQLLSWAPKEKTAYPSSKLSKRLGTTVVFDTYWKLAARRQDIFFARLHKDRRPWTKDPILQEHKFTNAYRASDRVSQFLIQKVIYEGDQSPNEVFFRTILFKLFNKIETWLLLTREFGEISYDSFKTTHYEKVLTDAKNSNKRIYSAAYIMPTGGRCGTHQYKHQMHLELVKQMMTDSLPQKISDAQSMEHVFQLLKSYPGIGDFLAYQYAIDINYSTLTDFPETEFVVPGPGAKDGIKKCFTKTNGLTESEIIKIVMDHQEEEFSRLGIDFKTLWGRPLQLIDCQNLFCETDKYARVKHPEFKGKTGRSKIKQKFNPNPIAIQYWYPPKWNLNEKIRKETGK